MKGKQFEISCYKKIGIISNHAFNDFEKINLLFSWTVMELLGSMEGFTILLWNVIKTIPCF